tara:strand:- start:436 stop:756 length:321 start_codon:yes stop_codon:yes gene_type:complete
VHKIALKPNAPKLAHKTHPNLSASSHVLKKLTNQNVIAKKTQDLLIVFARKLMELDQSKTFKEIVSMLKKLGMTRLFSPSAGPILLQGHLLLQVLFLLWLELLFLL